MVVEAIPIQEERVDPAPSSARQFQELIPEDESLALGAPSEFFLATLADRRLRVVKPIHVLIRQEEGQFVAEADELEEFGFEESRAEALRELQRAIVALFYTLQSEEMRLGPSLRATWTRLREKVTPTLVA
jgi:hypothetical protein